MMTVFAVFALPATMLPTWIKGTIVRKVRLARRLTHQCKNVAHQYEIASPKKVGIGTTGHEGDTDCEDETRYIPRSCGGIPEVASNCTSHGRYRGYRPKRRPKLHREDLQSPLVSMSFVHGFGE